MKKRPKWSAPRILFTSRARLAEAYARFSFESHSIPLKEIPIPFVPGYDVSRTAVTPRQMGLLVCALKHTENISKTNESCVVEVGSYLAETTTALAQFTKRTIVAVDPFMGYGGAESDHKEFKNRIAGRANIRHLQLTSGEAAATFNADGASLVFVDAVHDYVNVAFDIKVWSGHLVRGGLLALHDVDSRAFAGARMAARRALASFELWAHIPDLLVMEKR